jgi:hypothetical protein
MSDENLIHYARDLATEVEDALRAEAGAVYSEEEFTRLVLDKLGDDGALDNPIPLYQEGTFGRTHYKITGFSIPDTEDRLLLVATVHTGDLPPRDLTSDELRSAVTQAVNFYKCSCDGPHTKIEPSNTEASDLARRIYELRDQIEVLRIVLISDGLTGLKSLDLEDAKGTRVIVDLYGIERLQRILGDGLTRDDIVLDVVAQAGMPLTCFRANAASGDYDAYMTAIPASLLADVYEKYGTRLLELNVRAFLGVCGRKSVNAGLRRTILEEPEHFLAYNNGIVATADDIEVTAAPGGSSAIKLLRGLQIVNGGQTTASLHRARKQDKSTLDGIMVPAKIIKVKAENLDAMVAAISRFANSQNTVQPADFSANDPFHVTVETLANNTWLPDQSGRWFYERARGSYGAAELKASFGAGEKRRFAKETPKERRFSKTDLAKYLNAWDGLPDLVSLGNQKNFQSFMQGLKEQYPEGFTPDQAWFRAFVAKAIVFRTVQEIVRARKFQAYQANIVCYTVACLSWKSGGRIDFERVWSHQAISKELRAMIDHWVVVIDRQLRATGNTRMVSEWAKRSECWEEVRNAKLEIEAPVPPELETTTVGPSVAESGAPETSTAGKPDADSDDLMCDIRQVFRGAEVRTREDVIVALRTPTNNRSLDAETLEEVDNAIRTAVRRGILEHKGDGLAVCARSISDYERSFLKATWCGLIEVYYSRRSWHCLIPQNS